MSFTFEGNRNGIVTYPVEQNVLKPLSGYHLYKGAALTLVGNSALAYCSGIDKVYAISNVSATSAQVTANYDLRYFEVNPYQIWKNINVTAITSTNILFGQRAASGLSLLTGSYGTALDIANSAGGLVLQSGLCAIQTYRCQTATPSATWVVFVDPLMTRAPG